MPETWNNFPVEKFTFEGHEAIIVTPRKPAEEKCLVLKTEYWNAFPGVAELGLLERGLYLCYIKNDNRWGTDDNVDRQARFVRFTEKKYGLLPRCVLVGMSCGGLIAIKFAARYPEMVSCMYLDAPVVNYMSCPCGFGIGNPLSSDNSEILSALGMTSISELLSCREMPLDDLPRLVAARIPVVLVAGDSDRTVPFCENGALVEKAYQQAGIELEVYIKPGCDHHPHGLSDPAPVLNFILRHCGAVKNDKGEKQNGNV